MTTPYLGRPRPRLFAHRGASGTWPENTLESFRAGHEAGARFFELDVHATADGQVVVLHDPDLDRTTNGTGPVKELPLKAVQALDAGHRFESNGEHPHRGRGIRIPTLAELLAEFSDVPVNIEIKQEDPAIERAVLGVLDRFGARPRTLLAAEGPVVMQRIRRAAPDVITSACAPEVADFVRRVNENDLAGYRPPFVALQVPPSYGGIDIVTESSVRVAHDLGLEVHVWTINEEPEVVRLLELGVDGIMTDFPAMGAGVFRRLGLFIG